MRMAALLAENVGDKWNNFIDNLQAKLTDTEMWTASAIVFGRIVLIIVLGRLGLWILGRIIDHLTAEKDTSRLKLRSRRVQTVGRLLKNTGSYTLHFIVLLLILGEFHINLGPLIAGAGIIGLAIGFGAQSLVKDVITGFFIILEDQFAVGDVIQTGNFRGTVEMIGLRATRIRSWTGEVHIIPNGLINEVTNYSINNAVAVVDIPIAHEDRLDQATEVVKSVLAKVDDPNMTGQPELLGVQAIGATEVLLRVTVECKPNTQPIISRRIFAEVKRAFEEQGMEAPYPRMVTVQRVEGRDRAGGV